MKTETLKSANDVVRHARGDRDSQLVYLLDAMIARINQLEARLDRLSDLTVGDSDMAFDDRVLRVIEENSYTTFTHLEAEIDEKLDQMTQSYGFAEAVEEAVKGSIVSTVEDVISELGVIDPEEIVRQGLKAII